MIKTKKWSGKQIGMQGIYSGVPIDRYHSGDICIEPSISSSGLRTIFNESPKHYWAFSPYNPKRYKDDETDALLLGRAAHHLLFGQEKFLKEYAVRPDVLGGEKWHSNRTACKIWLQDRAKEGLTVVTAAQIETIKGMAEAMMEEPLVKAGILNGLIEHSWFWKDKETGVWLKVRPDATPNASLDFADLKTTASVLWNDLQRTIRDNAYYQQAALVAEACKEVVGKPMNSFTLVFVEKKPPFCVAIVSLKENDIERGMKANRVAIDTFADCMKSGKWPGPGGGYEDARYIELPEWDQKRIDEKIQAA